MSMQPIRLEQKDHVLVAEIQLPANGEPDAIVYGERVFIRRGMKQTEPPQKNTPEVYFEASTYHMTEEAPAAPSFNRITETVPALTAKSK